MKREGSCEARVTRRAFSARTATSEDSRVLQLDLDGGRRSRDSQPPHAVIDWAKAENNSIWT